VLDKEIDESTKETAADNNKIKSFIDALNSKNLEAAQRLAQELAQQKESFQLALDTAHESETASSSPASPAANKTFR
jgi:hypothetical protein